MSQTLEAQLLKIIEEQQQQLKQQQKAQDEALALIQVQAGTITQLKQLTTTLENKHSEAVRIVKKYQEIVKKMSEQTISEHFSQTLQTKLANDLKAHVEKLVTSLDVQAQSKALIKEILPELVQKEIEKQTKPLAEAIQVKLDSVEQYHAKFADLIQKVSSRL